MKIFPARPKNRALSLPELIVIMAVVGLIAAVLLPAVLPRRNIRYSLRIYCVSQLKNVALASLIWAGDHGDQYPMAVYTNATGGPAFADSSNVFRYFQIMSNELSAPNIVWCPEDRERQNATNFTSDFNNLRVSYFVGLQARHSNPNMFLAGDRNFTNGMARHNGLLEVATNQVAGWTHQIHHGAGNIAITDGSVQQLTSSGLNTAVLHSGATNWLLFP